MSTWAEIFEVIRLAIRDAAGLADGLVIDYDAATPFASDALIRLRVLDDTGCEPRPFVTLSAPDPEDGFRCVRTLWQQREVVVTAHCEALTPATAKSVAHDIVDGLDLIGPEAATTLELTGPSEWLASCNVVLVGVEGGIVQHSRTVDGRTLAVYTIDLRFRYLRERTDPALVRTIAEAEISLSST